MTNSPSSCVGKETGLLAGIGRPPGGGYSLREQDLMNHATCKERARVLLWFSALEVAAPIAELLRSSAALSEEIAEMHLNMANVKFPLHKNEHTTSNKND